MVSTPLLLYGVPDGADFAHHYRLALGFYESIKSGNLFPSWLAHTNQGYGDPSVRFYPPALYYLLSLARLLTRDWYWASLLTFTLLNVAGGAGAFIWARELTTDDRFAVAAALLFLLSPFHANELYQAALYGQYAGASVLPFMFAFVERIIRRGGWRNAAALGLSCALLILSHLPMAVLGLISLSVYAGVRLWQQFSWRAVYQQATGALLGALLSCWYWLPMLRELKWRQRWSGAGQEAWFDYNKNFLFRASPNETGDWWLTFLLVATLLLAAPAVLLLFKRNGAAMAAAIVAALSFIMATPLSKPLWDALPPLQETQFPWRWLTMTSLCLSVLTVLSIPEIIRRWQTPRRLLALLLGGLTLIAASFSLLQISRNATFHNHQALVQIAGELSGSKTNQDFLPVWATQPPREMNAPVEISGRNAELVEWASERKVFRLNEGLATIARLKLFYYPYWTATADGQPLAAHADADGALLIDVPSQAATIEVKFTEPSSTRVAAFVSVLGLLLFGWLLLAGSSPRNVKR